MRETLLEKMWKQLGMVLFFMLLIEKHQNFSITSIGISAFLMCSGLSMVVIGENVETIGGWAFSSYVTLISVIILSAVTSIEAILFLDVQILNSSKHRKEILILLITKMMMLFMIKKLKRLSAIQLQTAGKHSKFLLLL